MSQLTLTAAEAAQNNREILAHTLVDNKEIQTALKFGLHVGLYTWEDFQTPDQLDLATTLGYLHNNLGTITDRWVLDSNAANMDSMQYSEILWGNEPTQEEDKEVFRFKVSRSTFRDTRSYLIVELTRGVARLRQPTPESRFYRVIENEQGIAFRVNTLDGSIKEYKSVDKNGILVNYGINMLEAYDATDKPEIVLSRETITALEQIL